VANPVLTGKRFGASAEELQPGWAAPSPTGGAAPPEARPTVRLMSANGTFAKAFLLWGLLLVGGAYGWTQTKVPAAGEITVPGWTWIALLGALGLAMLCAFVPRTAPVTAPLYALAEGVFIGVISRLYDAQWNGIVLQAVLATVAVFFACLVLYVSGAVKVSNKFIFVVFAATAGIFLMYFATMLLSVFGVEMAFWREPSALGIAISVGICIVASLNLFVDFEFIRRMAVARQPKQMEWYGAFGLTVTLVWLYLEILRLIGLLRD